MIITFEVAGIPISQPRPRVTFKNGHAWAYESEKAKNWKATIRIMAMSKLLRLSAPDCPITLNLLFRLPRPKSLIGKDIDHRHINKVDIDNLSKIVMDALTNAYAWKDDSQVWHLVAEKKYATGPGNEGVEITIEYQDV